MDNAKIDLYNFVNTLRNRLDINFDSYPLNTIDICNELKRVNITYHKFKTNGFCAAVLLGNKTDTVILNSNRTDKEINFDCGHEIVHMAKHRDKGIDSFSCMELKTKRQSNISFLEWEANEGAAELLVPYKKFIPEWTNMYSNSLGWYDIDGLIHYFSNLYFVSDAVISFRLQHLKYEIHQYLSDVRLCDLELLSDTQQKRRGITMKSAIDIRDEKIKNEMSHFNIDIYPDNQVSPFAN